MLSITDIVRNYMKHNNIKLSDTQIEDIAHYVSESTLLDTIIQYALYDLEISNKPRKLNINNTFEITREFDEECNVLYKDYNESME